MTHYRGKRKLAHASMARNRLDLMRTLHADLFEERLEGLLEQGLLHLVAAREAGIIRHSGAAGSG